MKNCRRRAFIIALVMSILLNTTALYADTDFQVTPTPTDLSGIFYNTAARVGGTVTINRADFQPTAVTGFMNFTQRPEDTIALCGAGDLNGTLTGDLATAIFTSNDPQPNCGFDRNGIFTVTGTVELDNSYFAGDYAARNANGSNLAATGGVFELWQAGNQPERKSYSGTFIHTGLGRGGPVTMDISIGNNTVSGYMNFTNTPGQSILCGAGEFTGVRQTDIAIL